MSNNEKYVGINKGSVEEVGEYKYREVHKEYKDDV